MTALALALLTGGCELSKMTTERIRKRPTRRDLTKLAPTDPIIEIYKFAVSQMKALPSSDPRNWINQARIHLDHCPHGNWYFLPWHRAYLYYFEEICRELSGDDGFALPYWNWTALPSVPSVFWGDTSNPLFYTPRTATQSSQANAGLVGRPNLESILNEPNFLVFASDTAAGQRDFAGYGRLEGGPHNYIHGFVGGFPGMGDYWSPRDPVFWTHHNMVECCWVNWNIKRQHPNTNDPTWAGHTFTEFVDRHGSPVSITVNQTLLYPIFAYQFEECFPEEPSTMRAPARSDRDIEEFIRRGASVTLDFLDRAVLREEMALEVDRPLTKAIQLKEEQRGMFLRPDPPNRLLLTVGGVELPAGSDVYVRVFVNKPDATPDTPITDPHYAGSFAFFNGHREGQAGPASARFVVDLTDAVRRLGHMGTLMEAEGPRIQLVTVPHPDREVKERRLRVDRLELGVSRPPRLQ